MPYDVRDILGHWVKPRSREGEMCPHACCRGRRPHPDNFPVILSRAQLRGMSERQLVYHLNKHAGSDRAVKQIVAEMDEREQTHSKASAAMLNQRSQRSRGRAARRQAADTEYRAYLESEWSNAERATNGYMLNRAGNRADIDPRSLWTAPDATRAKYASEELRRYWDAHPPVSRAEFLDERGAAQTAGARARRESRLYGVY